MFISVSTSSITHDVVSLKLSSIPDGMRPANMGG
jgi:hypothetical protein